MDTGNIVIFVPEKLHKFFISAGVDQFVNMIVVPQKQNIVQYSLERLFGVVIKGRPSNISTFLQISGGKLDTVMVQSSMSNITHRRDNRIQFISSSNKSSNNVICILSEVKGQILIDFDDHLKDETFSNNFEEILDICVTPSLS